MASSVKLFAGVDGGQTHTKAVISDRTGSILGFGTGGAIDHGKLQNSDEKLQIAVADSINMALENAGLTPEFVEFRSIYYGLSGGSDHKEAAARNAFEADVIEVGHDAFTALYGATGGKPGIVVIAGTGSIVFGIDQNGETARAGGLGFLFSDCGSGFWLAKEAISLAIKEQDGAIENHGLEKIVLDFFDVSEIRQLTNAFYNNEISRDKIAAFAETVIASAQNGNKVLCGLLIKGIRELVLNVSGTANKLQFEQNYRVCGTGGLFQNQFFGETFKCELNATLPIAAYNHPEFPPVIGALLLAIKRSGISSSDKLINKLKTAVLKHSI